MERERDTRRYGVPRVYQYATGRGGVPLEHESPMWDFDEEDRVYQYATGRGGHPISPDERAKWERQYHATHFGKGPKNWKRSDERIREEACEALYSSYDVDASNIEVNVKDGCIHLRGTVDSRRSKILAEQEVEDIAGVTDVQNELRIEEPQLRLS